MRNKLMVGLLFSLVILASMVLGAFPLDSPADGGRLFVNESFPVQVSTGLGGVDNCQLTISDVSGLTNLSASFTSDNRSNESVTQDGFTLNISVFQFQDHNRYNLSVICSNFTGAVQSVNWSDEILVDNTVPTAPTSLTSGTFKNRTFTLQSTVVGVNTTSCALTFTASKPVSNVPAVTHSGDSCSLSLTNANDGTYGYSMTSSDGSNTTGNSATAFFTVDTGKGAGSTVVIQDGKAIDFGAGLSQQNKGAVFSFLAMALVVILLVISSIMVILWINKKK